SGPVVAIGIGIILTAAIIALITQGLRPFPPLRSEFSVSYCNQEPYPTQVSCGEEVNFCVTVELIGGRLDRIELEGIRWSDSPCDGAFLPSNSIDKVRWIAPSNLSSSAINCTIEVEVTVKITNILFGTSMTQRKRLRHTLSIMPNAILRFSRNSLNLNLVNSQQLSIIFPNRIFQDSRLILEPGNNAVALNNLAAGDALQIPISMGSTSQSFSIRGLNPGNSQIQARMTCFQSVNLPITVSPGSISLRLSPTESDLQWGNNTSIDFEVQSNNGFSGNVNIRTVDSVYGANLSFSPSNLSVPQNGQATGTIVVDTVAVGTEAPDFSITVEADPVPQGVRTDRENFKINILRTPGDFVSKSLTPVPVDLPNPNNPPDDLSSISCGNIRTFIVASRLGSGGSQLGWGVKLVGIQGVREVIEPLTVGFTISPNCRVAFFSNLRSMRFLNVGFDPTVFNTNLGSAILTENPSNLTISQLFFSPDDSLVLVQNVTSTSGVIMISLFDMLRRRMIGNPTPLTGTVNSASLRGSTVTATTSSTSIPFLSWNV
ncbi:MAG: hypothetical protein AAGC85_03520, partial [Bacteroidota bacterium]